MSPMTERNVFNRLLFSVVLLIISLVTSGVVWGHWAYTLNTCPGYDCGCVLFGVVYAYGFAGGHVEYCQYITFVQIPVFITSAVLTFYYGYRVFIKVNRKVKNSARRSNPMSKRTTKNAGTDRLLDTVQDEPELPSLTARIILLVTSALMAVLLLSAAGIATAGFYSSCKEYRRFLVNELALSGNAAQVVGSRITCPAVFDFLDYLQPDRVDFDEPLQYSRKDRINTGVTLLIAKTALFMNSINWLFLTYFSIKTVVKGGCCRKKQVSFSSQE